MAADTVRFGIVGTGGMGSGHCNMMAQIPEAKLAALCDVNPDTLQPLAAKYDVPAFATHQELLDSGLVDAVIIATPHYFHPPIAEDAFAKGIHVLSEKPVGVTVGAVDKMIAAAKASGLKFGAMFQMRAEPQNQAAKQIAASGVLGNIYRTSLVMGWYRSQAYYNSGGWRATWVGEGGGVLINQAPHYLDLFTWLAACHKPLRAMSAPGFTTLKWKTKRSPRWNIPTARTAICMPAQQKCRDTTCWKCAATRAKSCCTAVP